MIPVPLNVLNGLAPSVLLGKVLLASVTVPDVAVSNTAFFKVNLISSIWSGSQVDIFADLNNTPEFGCSDTFLSLPITVPPNLLTYAV